MVLNNLMLCFDHYSSRFRKKCFEIQLFSQVKKSSRCSKRQHLLELADLSQELIYAIDN